MNTKEKLLLTEIIQDGAETVSDCITALGVAEYMDKLDFEQLDIDSLHAALTEFLAKGGSETHSKPYMSECLVSKRMVVYQANFAGVEIFWDKHEDYLNSYNPALFMIESHVVL